MKKKEAEKIKNKKENKKKKKINECKSYKQT